MGGGIRVKRADYFLNNSILMHGENVIIFGEGYTETIYLKRPYILTNFRIHRG